MGTPGQLLMLPLAGPTDPRFVVLRREIVAAGNRMRQVARPLHDADMRPLLTPTRHLRLLP